MPAKKGHTLIYREKDGAISGPSSFPLDPAPEQANRSRRWLTTLIELPGGAIYRETHGEGIGDVILEGTFGVKLRQAGGVQMDGRTHHLLFEQFIEDYAKQATESPRDTKLEFHDWDADKHFYCEPISLDSPRGSENRNHFRYVLNLKLYEEIKLKIVPAVEDPLRAIDRFRRTLQKWAKKLSEWGKGISGWTQKALSDLQRNVLQPVSDLVSALGDFANGVTSAILFPVRSFNKIANHIATTIESLGTIAGETLTQFANTLRQTRRTINRFAQFPQYFSSTVGGAAEDLADAWQDLTEAGEDETTRNATLYGENSLRRAEAQALQRRTQKRGAKKSPVMAGDTMQRIALREYGDASRWVEIALLNGFDSNDDLVAGATILIPTDPATADSAIVGDMADSRPISAEERLYGRDFQVVQDQHGKLDLVWTGQDLATIAGLDNLKQAVLLKTRIKQGTLLEEPAYGLRDIVGRSQSSVGVDELKWGLRVAAESDPRIARATVKVETTGNLTRYEYTLYPVGLSGSQPTPVLAEGLA